MKRYKRILSLALILILGLGLMTPAFAQERDPAVWSNRQMFDLMLTPPAKALAPENAEQAEFWRDSSMYLDGFEDGKWVLAEDKWKGDKSLEETLEEIKTLSQSLTRNAGSETEKARAIFDWVVGNITYNTSWTNHGLSNDGPSTFSSRMGICGGFTNLSNLMLAYAGLTAANVSGTAANGSAHAWSAVYVDGRWLLFDTTFGKWDISPDFHIRTYAVNIPFAPVVVRMTNDGVISASLMEGYDCPSELVLPDGVTTIEDIGFAYCDELTAVTFPKSLTTIGAQSFIFSSKLTSITFPDSLTSIGQLAFVNSGLTNVAIPDSVTEIGQGAFDGCTGLTDVYYGGDQAQWKTISIGPSNEPLNSATIHYKSSMPSQPTASTANIAYASTQTVNVDGKAVTFECYALKEGNGMTNYIKLRDLAVLLNGSAAQFQVGWDGSVTITTKTAYTPNGSELSTPYSGDRTYQETNAATKVNGQAADLAAFVLNDDQGGGYTYYQLRDLGKALGFNVGWAADKGIFVETDKPYDANN